MLSKNRIKKLAQLTFEDGIVQEDVVRYATVALSKKELKDYLFYIKQILNQSTVFVTTVDTPSDLLKSQLQDMFKDKIIEYKTDRSQGAGIYIKANDNIWDATIKGMIKRTIKKLKE